MKKVEKEVIIRCFSDWTYKVENMPKDLMLLERLLQAVDSLQFKLQVKIMKILDDKDDPRQGKK